MKYMIQDDDMLLISVRHSGPAHNSFFFKFPLSIWNYYWRNQPNLSLISFQVLSVFLSPFPNRPPVFLALLLVLVFSLFLLSVRPYFRSHTSSSSSSSSSSHTSPLQFIVLTATYQPNRAQLASANHHIEDSNPNVKVDRSDQVPHDQHATQSQQQCKAIQLESWPALTIIS